MRTGSGCENGRWESGEQRLAGAGAVETLYGEKDAYGPVFLFFG